MALLVGLLCASVGYAETEGEKQTAGYKCGDYIYTLDENPERLPREEWRKVDVITCAAPNLRHRAAKGHISEAGEYIDILPDDLRRLHEKRARQILPVAAANGADILVLGAFGCGAFRNDPAIVALAYSNVLKECRYYFELIDFAIYCRDYESENYDVFAEKLTRSSGDSNP